MKNVAILISGRGSNMVAIAEAAQKEGWKEKGVALCCVVSNRPEAAGLEKAKAFGIPTRVVDHKGYATREDFERALIAVLDEFHPDVIVLAGFMRVLTEVFVAHYEGKILNIHPALLPLFKGLDTHQRAIDAGVRVHGCTVHFVSTELDGGAIIGQGVVPVLPSDTPDTLAHRGLIAEHILYPRVVFETAAGYVRLEGGRVSMDDKTAEKLAVLLPAGKA